jgi:UDP-N-acetylmuramoyl-L-alanyl-D-glutamate--2,6-diaminopimelate ligase
MKLCDLIADVPIENSMGNLDVNISSLTSDSRHVKEGSLFICIRGLVADGHHFLSEAVNRRAAAGLVEKGAECKVPAGFPLVEVENTRHLQGVIAARFYGYPAKKIKIISVTGTNGKTTTTYLIRSIRRRIKDSPGGNRSLSHRRRRAASPLHHP